MTISSHIIFVCLLPNGLPATSEAISSTCCMLALSEGFLAKSLSAPYESVPASPVVYWAFSAAFGALSATSETFAVASEFPV